MTWLSTLGLEGVEVLSESSDGRELRFQLSYQYSPPSQCECGGQLQLNGNRSLKDVVDLPVSERHVKLEIHRKRYVCQGQCGQSFTPTPDFVVQDFKLTRRVYRHMAEQFGQLDRSLQEVAERLGLSERSARRTFAAISNELAGKMQVDTLLGDVVLVRPIRLGTSKTIALLNARAGTITDLLSGVSETSHRVSQLAGRQLPRYVLIPADESLRQELGSGLSRWM